MRLNISCFRSTIFLTFLYLQGIRSLISVREKNEIQDVKIINGNLAPKEKTQHQTSIRKRLLDGYFFGTGHVCGGSLISKNVVLSAAHCFVDQKLKNGTYLPFNDFIVIMGNLDRFEQDNSLSFDILRAFYTQNVFNLETFDDDIALLILNDSVPIEHPFIKPVMLIDGCTVHGYMCEIAGWGLTEEEELSDVLLTVDVPIIDQKICRKQSTYGERIRDGMICAGYLTGYYDACQGDSGGPLICGGAQVGIISWGVGCAIPLQPGVYTNISFYKNWILEQVNNCKATPPTFIKSSCSVSKSNDSYGDDFIFIILALLLFNYMELYVITF